MNGTSKTVKLDVWAVQDSSKKPYELFPEQKLGFVKVTDKTVGIAASGGGSRSHALCAGYFRGLREMGKLDKIDYLSSVSGGTWASAIFTYAKMDDQRLLGDSLPPANCSLDFLETSSPGQLALAVEKFLSNPFALLAGQFGEKSRNWWPRYIGRSLLEQFHLNRKLFAINEKHKAYILEQNKGNYFITDCYDEVVCPPKAKKRPFLIMNGVLEGPKGYGSGWGAPLQFTPLYSGVPFYAQNEYSFNYLVFGGSITPFAVFSAGWNAIFSANYSNLLQGLLNRDLKTNFVRKFDEEMTPTVFLKKGLSFPLTLIKTGCRTLVSSITGTDYTVPLNLVTGGGFVSTHAFGLKHYAEEDSIFGGGWVTGLTKKDNPFFLEDAVGISSAAFGAYGQNYGLDSTLPKLPYLPVLSKTNEKFGLSAYRKLNKEEYLQRAFGDGGNFENTGILPLVQRGVKRIIAFVNTSEPLLKKDIQFQPGQYRYNGEWCADPQFLCLFGQGQFLNFAGNYTLNQIFEEEELDGVLSEMIENRDKKGRGAVVKKKLKVVDNKYWGISGGEEIEILFLYNEKCNQFNEALPDETRHAIGVDTTFIQRIQNKIGKYSDFPHYPTTRLAIGRIFSLEHGQINLAAAHAEYVISVANGDIVNEIFD